MAENSKIEWTDHTFNPWVGCQKVSPGCDNCYAEAMMDKRWGKVEWGPHGERKRTSDANWKQPLRWAKAARGTGKRPRVFCASLADVFDNHVPQQWRSDLFALIEETPELDWLLLTKRPELVPGMLWPKWDDGLPPNIWLGTTCEDRPHYERRWAVLRRIRAHVRFISYEPALGPLSLLPLMSGAGPDFPDWIICGGESGHNARPFNVEWADSIVAQCKAAEVACFVKQLGAVPLSSGYPMELKSKKGGEIEEWPDNLRVREFPRAA